MGLKAQHGRLYNDFTLTFDLFSGNEVIVLGELEKWVPMSARRVINIRLTSTALTLTLGGQPGEQIVFSYLLNQQVVNVTVTADSAGCAAVHIQPTTTTTTAASVTTSTTSGGPTTEQHSAPSASAAESSSHPDVQTTENPSSARLQTGENLSPAHTHQNSVGFKVIPSSSLGGSGFVRVFGSASEKSCRFAPPPFTPPPTTPTTTPMTQPTTHTSPKHTSSPGPGGGASGQRLSIMIMLTTLISHTLGV